MKLSKALAGSPFGLSNRNHVSKVDVVLPSAKNQVWPSGAGPGAFGSGFSAVTGGRSTAGGEAALTQRKVTSTQSPVRVPRSSAKVPSARSMPAGNDTQRLY